MIKSGKTRSQLLSGSAALALALAAMLCGCNKDGGAQDKYDAISTSQLGLGISFGQSPETARATLGNPDGTVERQAKRNIDEYYRPEFSRAETTAPGPRDTHLSMSYLDGQLVRVYAHYNPASDHPEMPPFVPEVMPGVTLGATRQQFDNALGAPKEEEPAPKWVFENKDGSQVMLLAEFIDPAPPIDGQEPKTGPADVVCVSLTVAHAGPAPQSRGEEFEKSEERKKRLKGTT